jgi:hypothetical protein
MIRKVRFGNTTIPYSIIKSNRRKTSQITVDKDNVVVRTPSSKTTSEIKKIVDGKKKWIFRKQLEFQKQKSDIAKFSYTDGTKFLYLGRNLTLKILKNKKTESVSLKKDMLIVSIKPKRSSKARVKKLCQEWMMEKSSQIFSRHLNKISKKLKLKPRKIIIKNLKDRWGSTTSDNTINLNMNLIKAPKLVIDYVILHELCHLKIKGHSYKFWQMVRRYMPNYEDQKHWLELNNVIIF